MDAAELKLRLLRYLVTVVDHGHFGNAAAALHVATPTLSQQIRQLEAQVGIELLDRAAHPIRPTESGERFVAEARECLAAAERALGVAAIHQRRGERLLRIGFISAGAGPLTHPILVAFAKAAPEATVDLVQLDWPAQVSALRDGTVDASFARPPILDGGVHTQILLTEPRVAILPAAHRLAGREQVSIGELNDEVQVSEDKTDPRWSKWWSVDPRPDGTPVRYGPVVHTVDEMLEVVRTGRAIGITARSVREHYQRAGVRFVPITDIEPCHVALCTRTGDHSHLITVLRKVAEQISRKP